MKISTTLEIVWCVFFLFVWTYQSRRSYHCLYVFLQNFKNTSDFSYFHFNAWQQFMTVLGLSRDLIFSSVRNKQEWICSLSSLTECQWNMNRQLSLGKYCLTKESLPEQSSVNSQRCGHQDSSKPNQQRNDQTTSANIVLRE